MSCCYHLWNEAVYLWAQQVICVASVLQRETLWMVQAICVILTNQHLCMIESVPNASVEANFAGRSGNYAILDLGSSNYFALGSTILDEVCHDLADLSHCRP